jgi:hemolysin III
MQNPVRGILHGSAALLSLIGGAVLWSAAPQDLWHRAALLVFAASLFGLYATSTLYHCYPWSPLWKRRMQRLDHAMIYVLVSGTYTPMIFIVLDGPLRALSLAFVWGITVVGVAQKIWWPDVGAWLSITLQTLQGWFAVILVAPLAELLPWPALELLLAGGIAYTVGMVAFVTQRPSLWPRVFSYHEVFHVLVVAGSAAHYTMTLRYIAGFPGI